MGKLKMLRNSRQSSVISVMFSIFKGKVFHALGLKSLMNITPPLTALADEVVSCAVGECGKLIFTLVVSSVE